MADLRSAFTALFERQQSVSLLQTADDFGAVRVYQERGNYILSFDDRFEQSSMDPARPHKPLHRYVRAMLLVLAWHQPGRVLHLGLGGGALLRSLAAVLPGAEQTAVELRRSVIDAARTYFALPENARIVCDNAFRFAAGQAPAGFDLVFADLYLAHGMDVSQKTQRFVEHLARLCADQGWVVFNFTRLPDFDDSFFRALALQFREILIAPVACENYIIFAGKAALPQLLECYAPRVQQLAGLWEVKLAAQYQQLKRFSQFFGKP